MNCISSLGLAAESSVAICSDIDALERSSLVRTASASFASANVMESCPTSRSSATFADLMGDLTGEELTLWLAGFPVKPTAAHLEDGLWRTISGRTCGGSWQISLPGLSLPRTSAEERSIARPTTWKRWVTQLDACRFRRQTWVLTMFGSASGYLHTPTCTANYAAPSMQKWPVCREFVRVLGKPTPTNHEWLMAWPIGWSGLQPLAMDRFQQWQHSHSLTSHAALIED